MKYDGIILAAGRNTRLRGVVPSYHKPLMIVNGRPLVVSLVKNTLLVTETVTVLVSPENCGPIAEVLDCNDVLDHRVNLVVQPSARGPGDGLYRALQATTAERIVLVCGDNVVPVQDLLNTVDTDEFATRQPNLVTASVMLTTDEADARRFTRIPEKLDEFIETDPAYLDLHDAWAGRGYWSDKHYRCWVGPLIFDREVAEKIFRAKVLSYKIGDPECKISRAFNGVPGLLIQVVPGNSVDIGTSDALIQLED